MVRIFAEPLKRRENIIKYFDYAATCPLDQEAAQLYVQTATDFFGNTSSLHDTGGQAQQLLETCRKEFAHMLKVHEEGIYFTSGGSEGNFLAIQALLSSPIKSGNHIITSIAEHASIHSTLEKCKQNGYEVTAIPLNQDGHIDVETLTDAIRKETVLITIQAANSEIGTSQPIKEIGKICRDNGILLHSDCVQAFGKLDMQEMVQSVDSLAISGHKFYGPKGVGVVYLSPHLHWHPFYPNTTHEGGFRPGTVNVPGIAATTLAAQKTIAHMEEQYHHSLKLRKVFLETINAKGKQIVVYPSDLPSIIGLRMKGIEGQLIMLECNRAGYAISTGSACQVGSQAPIKTMTALGIIGKPAKEFIRISFGKNTKVEDVQQLGETLIKILTGHGG
ncbi:IscS subfamily cysteine desulfurase [Lederbergia galactosidilytica]|uniref:IscS subfamily cysteine desulfurase n=1 Tax=Lederbergia galactosidilytica TaxID=217031 RepID=UPI000AC20EEE|nr:IscS subfamily cysteine desulfurase [Lederbergia galactosidilytica]MBP1913892.1 cysteine desulfurase [Lederbergia galactosidilytica]